MSTYFCPFDEFLQFAILRQMTTWIYVTEHNRALNTMNSELHFKHITLSNRYGHVYTLAHTLSRRRKVLSSFLVMLHMAYIKKCEKCINDMRLFYDKNIFSNKWVIKWDLHFIQRYCHVLYSVIFRYVSMWVGVFACVIGVDV